MMEKICPIKNLGHLINPRANKIYSDKCSQDCPWWDSEANWNYKTKEFEGQCCILSLAHPPVAT